MDHGPTERINGKTNSKKTPEETKEVLLRDVRVIHMRKLLTYVDHRLNLQKLHKQ